MASGPITAPRQCDADDGGALADLRCRPACVSGPTTAPVATDVVPRSWVPGCRTASAATEAVTSTQVVGGSTTVTPARISVVEHAVVEGAPAGGQLAPVVAAEDVVGVVGRHAADGRALGDEQAEHVGDVLLALVVVRLEAGPALRRRAAASPT